MCRFIVLFFLISIYVVSGQITLPNDLGQHNLTQFNSSLWFPTASYGWNTSPSLSVWGRWQFRVPDEDPNSLFANYTGNLGSKMRFGVGLLRNTTSDFEKLGGVLNFAHAFDLGSNSKLIYGLNLTGFQQKIQSPFLITEDELLGELTLGMQLMLGNFSILGSLNNLLDYNFSSSETIGNDRLINGALSYDFPIQSFSNDSEAFVRPIVYYRAMPNGIDAQYGISALLSTSKLWAQGGYNSLYGFSSGLGITFFKRFSIGGLIELSIDDQFEGEDLTFEVLLSYSFGKSKPKQKEVEETENNDLQQKEEEAERQRRVLDSLRQLDIEKKKRMLEDSISAAKKRETEILQKKRNIDSIAKANDVYASKVTNVDKGYYLIINVYSTQRYLNEFLNSLRRIGLNPDYFYREENDRRYVYLKRYDTVQEAVEARNSNFYGQYYDRIWIFQVL